VTQIIGAKIKQPFDTATISAKVAKKEGRTVAEVQAEWERKGIAGRNKGTQTHNYIESKLNKSAETLLEASDDLPIECKAFDKFWAKFSKTKQARCLIQEWPIGDADWGIAGKLDTILELTDDNIKNNHIFDWKTGKFETFNGFKYLKPPFDDLDENQLNIYSIQVSLYRLLLDKHTDLNIKDCYLVHLSPDGAFKVHKAHDFRSRLQKWLDANGHSFVDQLKCSRYDQIANYIRNNIKNDKQQFTKEVVENLLLMCGQIVDALHTEAKSLKWAELDKSE
jgi:hypothetical protein